MKTGILNSILFFLLITGSVYSQELSKLQLYRNVAKNGATDQLLENGKSAHDEALSSDDLPAQAAALKLTGLIHLRRLHNYEMAMDNFIRALTLEDSLGLKNEMIFSYIAIGDVYTAIGDYYKSIENFEQAQEINKDTDLEIFAFIKIQLGNLYAAVGRRQDAFDSYAHALEYKDEFEDRSIEAEALYHQGKLFAAEGKYDEALARHKDGLSIQREISDKTGEALSLNDIGELYHLMKNDEKSLANHVVALEIRQKLGNKSLIAESYNNIGKLYLSQKNYERAIANIGLALEAAQESNTQNEMLRSYELLSLSYKALGDYQKSLEYKEHYTGMLEMIQNERGEQRILDTQNRFLLEKKESQIGKLETIRAQREKEIAEQKKFRNVLLAAIALGVVIVILILTQYIQKRRSNKILSEINEKVRQQNVQLQELNVTKDKFFSIISHDLKGPLNSLTSFSGLLINHTDSLSKDEIRMLAKDLDKSLKNLFDLLENLLEWSRSQTGNIEFKAEVFDLNALLIQNRELLKTQAQNKNITLTVEDRGECMISAHKHSINTVVRNLISNAIKFTPAGGSITVATEFVNGNVKVHVRDTGVGMPKEVIEKLFRLDTKHTTKGIAEEKGTGLGLILCKDFVEKNGGTITVQSEVGKGSVFSFSLPGKATSAEIVL